MIGQARLQLRVPTFMRLDGQWQLVAPGTVFDQCMTMSYAASTADVLDEVPGELLAMDACTSVRNYRSMP